MNVGDPDGHGRYGVLGEDADGLLCHLCGGRFAHLGLHAWKGHGVTAADYRQAHGLARGRGLVSSQTREAITENARPTFVAKKKLVDARDPAAALAACRQAGAGMSPAALPGTSWPGTPQHRGRLPRCGASFCPLRSATRWRFCSRSRASKATKAGSR